MMRGITSRAIKYTVISAILLSGLKGYSQVLLNFTQDGSDVIFSWEGAFTHDFQLFTASGLQDSFSSHWISSIPSGSNIYYAVGVTSITSDASFGLFGPDAWIWNYPDSPPSYQLESISGGALSIDVSNSSGQFAWDQAFSTIVSSGSARIMGLSVEDLESASWLMDTTSPTSIHISAIPEPSTYAFMLGIVGLVLFAIKRFRRF